ncbi:phenylacetate--CoA ligase family protein [Clostridium akagii]|uniref:phenylacetate--CoA ligase family protein n=1 Tax=Clostridium akagii TaxID=91623 RepID=UPI000479A45E|nr:phenylacetate--CoA ligase family protein [Clostridium akagii]
MIDIIKTNLTGLRNNILREGKSFQEILDGLEKSQQYSLAEIKEMQNEKLKEIINIAYNYIPYYNEKFKSIKLEPYDIKSIDDLWKIPLLYKEDIKQNFNKLLSVKANKKLLNLGYTSGTTGTPAHFYRDLYSINFENATIRRHWIWAGYKKGDKICTLRGQRLFNNKTNNKFSLYNIFQNQLLLSSFHLSEENLPYYIEEIIKFKPKFFQGYPSTLYVLAKYMNKNNIIYKLDAIFTSSEPLYLHEKGEIQKAFQCSIWDFYGMAERVVSASECEEHDGLHLNEEYGVTEFVNNGKLNKTEGIIVGTTLNNKVMPLIRYVTNDYAKLNKDKCKCGRCHRKIYPIETKNEDMLYTPDGRWISPSVVTFAFKPQDNVLKSQLIQTDSEHIIVKLVVNDKLKLMEKNTLVTDLENIFGKLMKIDIQFVKDIERTKNGKYRWIISNIKSS